MDNKSLKCVFMKYGSQIGINDYKL